MFYGFVLLSGVAFVTHLALLDRLQRFRIVPLEWRGWWSLLTGIPTGRGRSFAYYNPKNYSPQGRRLLTWVYATGVAWLLGVLVAGWALRTAG